MVGIETQFLHKVPFPGRVRTSRQGELTGDGQEHDLEPPDIGRLLGLMVDAVEDPASQGVPQLGGRRSVREQTPPVVGIGKVVDEGEALRERCGTGVGGQRMEDSVEGVPVERR